MRHCFKTSLAGIALTCSLPVEGKVAAKSDLQPLKNLPVCSTARLMPPNTANPAKHCIPDRANRRVSLELDANTRSAIVVGGYRVVTDHYNEDYFPPVLEVRPGDTLAIHLRDNLQPSVSEVGVPMGDEASGAIPHLMLMPTGETNLHTHGLVVSPNNAGDAPGPISARPTGNGDNAFAVLSNNCGAGLPCRSDAGYSITIPRSLPNHIAGDDGRRTYPSGLSWYHPHIHGIAQPQVSGGMSGLISIGDPRDAIIGFNGGARNLIDVRYLALRDLQLSTNKLPNAVSGAVGDDATWSRKFDPKFCGERDAATASMKGYCLGPDDAQGYKVWLFTVNGQRFPRIDIPGGHGHLWRIANLSATVSYVLELRDEAGNLVPMKLVSLDGVVAGRAQPHPAGAASTLQIIERSSFLVMPASRIEILVPNFASHKKAKTYTLATRGFADASLSPDGWFPVDLAQVRLAPTSGPRSSPSSLIAPSIVADQPDFAALALPSAFRTFKTVNEAHPSSLCGHRLGSSERRLVRLVSDPMNPADGSVEALELGMGIANNADANAAGDAGNVIPATARTMRMGPDALDDNNHGCAVLGDSPEVWEIRNDTDEIHNFHIHQAKFRLAREDEIDAVTSLAYLSRHPKNGSGAATSASGAASFLLDDAPEIAAWHDTIPVMPHQSTFIRIAFTSPLQLGSFMIHCHILEHEDKGMMSAFEVLRAK
ncbi:multicopper oxidase domain-containing protein [soil metagenome]